jgi:hypothetical protein
MARANTHSTPIPRLAELVRDPTTRESFRKVRGDGRIAAFLDGKAITRRPSIKRLVFTDLLEHGDVIGRDPEGNFFVLITLSQRSFAWLCAADERRADMEVDDEDCGEDELHGQATGPGDAEDAEEDEATEEDDDAGGNVDEMANGKVASMRPGEDSLDQRYLTSGYGTQDREEDDDREDDDPTEATAQPPIMRGSPDSSGRSQA